mmetsp:Transcript_8924/g.16032  ORF Transcript_8924/g.16032 Transcript_8924/m.16032 type:complete len:328 (+) Transcript_8924:47-1030(+)
MAEGNKRKAVLVNAFRLDFNPNQPLDLQRLEALIDLARFDSDATADEIVQRAEGQEILITKEIPVPADAIKRLPDSVRLICEAGTGFNNIALDAARERGITVCNCPAYSTDAVAQLVITFMLNFSCSLVPQQRMLFEGNRENFSKALQLPHFELAGKTLGLVAGSGAIGSKVAQLAKLMGMNVLISSRKPQGAGSDGIEITTVEDLLSRSDFVSLHCPLTPDTRHLINASALKQMKPSAFIINTARGPIIHEGDLIEALKAGTIAGAGLDVQDVEPPPQDSPLYTLPNVILTPHIGWKRFETRQRLMDFVAQNVDAYLKGTPTNVVS